MIENGLRWQAVSFWKGGFFMATTRIMPLHIGKGRPALERHDLYREWSVHSREPETTWEKL